MVTEDKFNFYPHSCDIYRGETTDPVTGKQTPTIVYSGMECFVEEGYAHFLGDKMQGTDSVHLADSEAVILPGDVIDITLENGTHYNAKIKQAYPIEDDDIGGQELKLYERDATV